MFGVGEGVIVGVSVAVGSGVKVGVIVLVGILVWVEVAVFNGDGLGWFALLACGEAALGVQLVTRAMKPTSANT